MTHSDCPQFDFEDNADNEEKLTDYFYRKEILYYTLFVIATTEV